MTFAHSREHDFARSRDQLLDLLSTSPYVLEKAREEQAARIAARQELVDEIAAARKHVEEQLPALERTAAAAYSKMTAQLAKLRQAEGEYIRAVQALSDLQFQTDRTISAAERALEESSDEAITAFDTLCEDTFDQIRRVPIAEPPEPRKDPRTGLKVPTSPPHGHATQQQIVESLDLIRVLQRRARQMRLEAIGDVPAAIAALRAELPRVSDFR